MRLKAGPVEALPVEERSQVAQVRRRAQAMARRQNFSEAMEGELALTVTEATSNLLDHASGGEVVLSSARFGENRWIDVLVADQGPGIERLGRALAGGASTGNGLGQGLGAIRRLASEFEIYAPPEQGTVLTFRFYADETSPPEGLPMIGAVCRAKRRQTACGDAWGLRSLDGSETHLLLVADGVGHGEAASEASNKAVEALGEVRSSAPADLLHQTHIALEDTRGAAAAAVLLDPGRGRLSFCGVGNLQAAVITAEGRKGLASLNGVVGHGQIDLQEFEREWPKGALLIIHSDGLSSRWDLRLYPGLRIRHPSLVSGVLYRDFSYDHDDSTVLVVRRS